jgi:Cell wall-associated hydrolases (invasion-associated proteins)
MIQLNRKMLEFISNRLQIGDEAPSYALRVKRVEEVDLDPYEWRGVPKGALSIDISASQESGATNATVKIEDTYGLMSPEVMEYKNAKLVLNPASIQIKPGEIAQFSAFIKTPYNTILVGGPGASHPEWVTWKIVPIHDGLDHGDVSGLVINNGLVTNTGLNGNHYADCNISATYRGQTVTGALTIVDKTYIIDVDNPIFMVRDNEDMDGDWIYVELNGESLIRSNQTELNTKGYGVVGDDPDSLISGIKLKSVPELDASVNGFKPAGTDYSQYGKLWTEIPLKLKPGLNKLTITATWNGRDFNGTGWTMGNVTGNAQLCYPNEARTPKYTEDGSGGTEVMEKIYFTPIRVDMSTGETYSDHIAGPQVGLWDLAYHNRPPRQTVTWLFEYRSPGKEPDNNPIRDFTLDDPTNWYEYYDDTKLSDYNKSHYRGLLKPENYCQLALGYGDLIVPVITGAIDTTNVDSKESILTINVRDNMRYLIDQTIDGLKYGTALHYPKPDVQVIGYVNPVSTVNATRKVKLASNVTSVAVRTGPSIEENIIGTMMPGDEAVYLGTTNGWHNIMYGNSTGYVYGGNVEVYQSANSQVGTVPIGTYQQMIKIRDIQQTVPIYASASTLSERIGTCSVGNTFPYLRTTGGGNFYNIDYNSMSGYVESRFGELTTQSMDGMANVAVFEVVGVSPPFYLKSAPTETASSIVQVYNGDILNILGVDGDWRKVEYPVPLNGVKPQGWIYKDYTKLLYVPKPVDPTSTATKTEWKATDIVMDMAIDATTIRCFTSNALLDRTICNVLIEDYYVLQDGELSAYTVPSKSFSIEESYFDACMEVVNLLGDVSFRCTRYGDLYLKKNKTHTQLDTPDWIITDYVDLTSLTYKEDSVDQRNRVIVKSTAGWNMYEHPEITKTITKGVNRVTCITADFADTEQKRRVAAANFFSQILAKYKNISIAIKGNPLIEIGHVVRIQDLVSGVNDLYVVREWKHSFSDVGFITQLELNYISTVDISDLKMLTDQFPQSRDIFNYTQYMNSYETKDITIKYDMSIAKAKIRISKGNNTIADVSIVQDVVAHDVTENSATQYVIVQSNQCNVRLSPTGQVKRLATYGETFQYTGTTDDSGNVSSTGGTLPNPASSTGNSDWDKVSRFDSYFIEAGNMYGIDPCILKAVCMQESSGRDSSELGPDGDGAVGPMRVLDGSIVQGEYTDLRDRGLTNYTPTDLLNSRINILVAAQGMKYYYEIYNCTTIRAMLGYYNGGGPSNTAYPDSIDNWYVQLTGNHITGGLGGSFVVAGAGSPNGNWYLCKDHDGGNVYLWKNFCSLQAGGSTLTNVDSNTSTISNSQIQQFIDILYNQIGKPYEWSEDGPDSFDCSGLVQYALYNLTSPITFARVTYDQYSSCIDIDQSQLQPGDLCFAVYPGESPTGDGNHHVAVYVGDGQIIEAPRTGLDVRVTSLRSEFNYFGRIPELNGGTNTYTTTNVNRTTLPSGTTSTVTHVPDHFTISTTFSADTATEAEKNKASELNGNVLCATDGCVLYNVLIETSGSSVNNNQLRLKWASTLSDPISIQLKYDVMIF